MQYKSATPMKLIKEKMLGSKKNTTSNLFLHQFINAVTTNVPPSGGGGGF